MDKAKNGKAGHEMPVPAAAPPEAGEAPIEIQAQAQLVMGVLGATVKEGIAEYFAGRKTFLERELWLHTYTQTYQLQCQRYYQGADSDRTDIDKNGGPAQLAHLTADGAVRRMRQSVERNFAVAPGPPPA